MRLIEKIEKKRQNGLTLKEEERILEKEKNKKLKKYREHIKNKVDELHWKTINYLTKNYDTILIGNLKIQGVISSDSMKDRMTKLVGQSMCFYKFKQRLENKCKLKGIKYKEIDESYTSKICSACGNKNDKLKNDRVYKCKGCKMIMDRDINGARGIYIKIHAKKV
jgi:putative transposase